ncbi:hypothetical protein V491_00144 [Pseudogymnoascus sp. VKM F-3775]|nr:hypothetical protein V491_00144 [Pseudogymnoascus sp. VKM F-3775]
MNKLTSWTGQSKSAPLATSLAGAGSKTHIFPTLERTGHQSLKKTEVAGDENVDGIQRGVGGAVGDVFSSKGPAGVVGDGVDKGVLKRNI